jgi:hypothetical protein
MLLDEFLRARAAGRPFRARVQFSGQAYVDAARTTFLSHSIRFEYLSSTPYGVLGNLVGRTAMGDSDFDDWLRWILYPTHAELLGWHRST